ncbi:MAG TPA: nucleoside triphosphate pyrophosphohydrolase [Steroidobacteraceae bacterium]
MSEATERLEALLQLMARLRDPQQGCPWDRVQSFASIAPHTIEEAYELADAIESAEPGRIRDELGDLLFQVVFLAQLGLERGWFDFAAVAAALHEKLVRRHPHVFGGPKQDGADLAKAWDAHKSAERAAAGDYGALAGVPKALPALARAAKLGRRAARVGFDWSDARAVRSKIDEELLETESAVQQQNPLAVEEELGDLLFAIVNWARHLHVDPEAALRCANRKFEGRFAAMEALIGQRGWMAAELTAGQWELLWGEVKAQDGQES